MFLMFIAGAVAMWVIVRIATNDTPPTIIKGSEASYKDLQQSILRQ